MGGNVQFVGLVPSGGAGAICEREAGRVRYSSR